jgi:hypothetical protein
MCGFETRCARFFVLLLLASMRQSTGSDQGDTLL